MRTFLLGLVFALTAAGCSKDVTKDVENLADRACACKQADCARKVIADFVSLAENNKNATGDEDKAQAAARRMGTCVISAGMPAEEVLASMRKLQ